MDSIFSSDELLLRAVYPENKKPRFWHNGKLSSAAFKDKRGLSVDRMGDRTLDVSIASMRRKFQGSIVSVTVATCNSVNAYLRYLPSAQNRYHSEIHGSETRIELSDYQALKLTRSAIIHE